MPFLFEIHNEEAGSSQIVEIVSEIDQMTIDQYLTLLEISEAVQDKELPADLKTFKILKGICKISDIPKSASLPIPEILTIWNTLISEMSGYEIEPQQAESIEIDDVVYSVPATLLHNLTGQKQYLKTATLGEFCEASQCRRYFQNVQDGKYKQLPYLAAILCRKAGEQLPLEEDKRQSWIDERAKYFSKKMTMGQLLAIGFFLQQQKESFIKSLMERLQAVEVQN